jgi:uncharacterized membrane-anchored protein
VAFSSQESGWWKRVLVTSFKIIGIWGITSGLTETHGTSITSQNTTIALTVCSINDSELKNQELL